MGMFVRTEKSCYLAKVKIIFYTSSTSAEGSLSPSSPTGEGLKVTAIRNKTLFLDSKKRTITKSDRRKFGLQLPSPVGEGGPRERWMRCLYKQKVTFLQQVGKSPKEIPLRLTARAFAPFVPHFAKVRLRPAVSF